MAIQDQFMQWLYGQFGGPPGSIPMRPPQLDHSRFADMAERRLAPRAVGATPIPTLTDVVLNETPAHARVGLGAVPPTGPIPTLTDVAAEGVNPARRRFVPPGVPDPINPARSRFVPSSMPMLGAQAVTAEAAAPAFSAAERVGFDRLMQSATGTPAAAAPAAPAAPVQSGAYRMGARVASALQNPWVQRLGKFAGVAGTAAPLLTEGLTGEATVPNAVRTGLGIGAIVAPAAGVPLGTGALIGDAAMSAVGRAADRTNDILTPQFRSRVDAAGGVDAFTKSLGAGTPAAVPPSTPALPNPAALPVPSNAPVSVPGDVMLPFTSQGDQSAMRDSVMQTPGTGYVVNNQSGEGTFIDARQARLGGYGATGARYAPRTAIGGAVQSTLGLKNIVGDTARNTRSAKLAIDAAVAAGTIGKNEAEAAKAKLGVGLALAHLQANPDDRQGAAAILSGRSATGDKFSVPMGGVPLKPGDPTLVLNARTGALEMKTPATSGSVGKGTDGKFYLVDASGKATREATPAEKQRYEAAAKK